MLHRDIKPENLILESTGNAKLMDFGIARPIDRIAPGQTAAGFVVGTPQYLAPEILQGREADLRSDIYSCGIVLYELFAGTLPFDAPTAMEILVKHLREEPEPPSARWREIPPPLEAAILRCLRKDPDQRYRAVAGAAARPRRTERLRESMLRLRYIVNGEDRVVPLDRRQEPPRAGGATTTSCSRTSPSPGITPRSSASPSGWSVHDLKSTNGVEVNRVPVERAPLRPGDLLTIGSFEVRLEEEEPAPRPRACGRPGRGTLAGLSNATIIRPLSEFAAALRPRETGPRQARARSTPRPARRPPPETGEQAYVHRMFGFLTRAGPRAHPGRIGGRRALAGARPGVRGLSRSTAASSCSRTTPGELVCEMCAPQGPGASSVPRARCRSPAPCCRP